MKLNDYMWVSDLQLLSEQQYNSLMNYLLFIGIKSVESYKRMKMVKPKSIVLSVYEQASGVATLVWTSVDDNDLASKHSYEDIIRMAEMGELMTYENV